MTKLSKTYLGFSPGSSPAGRPASATASPAAARPPRRRAALVAAGRGVEVEGQDVGRPAVVRRRPSRGRRRGSPAAPQVGRAPVLGGAAVDRTRAAAGDRRAARAARRSPGRRLARTSRSHGGGADGVGPHAERAAAVVGAVPGGPVLLGALRLGGRPGPAGRLLVAGSWTGGSAGASSSWTATRMSRPNCSDSASASTRRMRDSSTVCVNSLGAASTAVSSTRPERAGQVEHRVLLRGQAGRQPLADLVPDRRQVQRGIGHAARSSPCCRPPAAPGRPAVARRVRRSESPLWIRGRTWFHTGVHRLCTAGEESRRVRAGRAADRHRCWSEAVRAGERAVRRSGDRRGRPTRRDPDVRRGATATLTAPSTARQRRPGATARPGASARGAPSPRSGGRRVDHGRSGSARPPAAARPRLCWSESVDGSARSSCAARRCRCACRSAGTSFRGSPGSRLVAVRAGAPRAPAHRWVRTVDVV